MTARAVSLTNGDVEGIGPFVGLRAPIPSLRTL